MKSALLIAVMAAVTLLLRALPFLVLRKRTPAYISYLGRVLPPAIIGMLVIYCLKDITPAVRPFGLPELAAAACVVGMQVWRRSALISILSGTAVYMLLIRVIAGAISGHSALALPMKLNNCHCVVYQLDDRGKWWINAWNIQDPSAQTDLFAPDGNKTLR